MSYGRITEQRQSSNAGLIIVIALLGIGLGYWWFSRPTPVLDPNAAPRTIAARGDLAADEKATVELFKSASPSVVHITTSAIDRWSFDGQEVPVGTGSGFIWDEQGHVVTNAHVIKDASSASVTLNDGTSYPAKLTGGALEYDLAVLKIDAPPAKLPAILVGTSKELAVGQKVFAIGNPFGLDQTLTTGIVSALGRRIKSLTDQLIDDAIQTDAAINPGNSGGPLLDSAGRLIGVNTQIVSPSGAYAGIGFAIPVDTVNRVVPELIRHGRITKPDMGLSTANDALARQWGAPPGVVVLKVQEEGPAGKAGIRAIQRLRNGLLLADIITAIDGQSVKSNNDLMQILSKHKIGDTITVSIRRSKEELEVAVTLAAG